jgi:hypothetical protein
MSAWIADIKRSAQADLYELAVAAGFHRSKGKAKFHCIGHPDRTASVQAYPEALYCYSCGGRWDVIDLEQLTGGGTNSDAIKRLAHRYGLSQEQGHPSAHPKSRQTPAQSLTPSYGARAWSGAWKEPWCIRRKSAGGKELWG